jgi:iron-sulfur cluster assembly protein
MNDIQLTQAAAERIIQYTQANGGVGLRLGLKKAGCSGWAYTVDMAVEVEPDDVIFEDRGAKVVLNESWVDALRGTEVDFVKEGLNQTFKFSNPNVKGECGCGESIAL